MNVVHLTASTFYGGPERQMLGLARAIRDHAETTFLSFSESGRCRPFLSVCKQQGFEAVALANDTPKLRAAVGEIAENLQRVGATALLCHGYKADLLGRPAARRAGIPAVSVSRGWTGETAKVRMYEWLDRAHLRFMDHVVAVSEAQAAKVRRAGVKAAKLTVIANAIDPERFTDPDPRYRERLERFFRPARKKIVGAAGRLSPEKGFDVLINAISLVRDQDPDAGFVIFGDGACKAALQQQIATLELNGTVTLAGFRSDLDRYVPQLDMLVLPSHTEGLPNVVLEACAAGVPVVATSVGGTPEVIEDGVSGLLVPPGDPVSLASAICEMLGDEEDAREMAFQGRQRVLEWFSFHRQVEQYLELFGALCPAAKTSPSRVQPEPTCEK
jgi:glycosyltransferase involved in cell wall biosynthesis